MDKIPTSEELNRANNFGERPELFAISTENPNFIKKLFLYHTAIFLIKLKEE